MKAIIFVRIADMKYYHGVTEDDQPHNGGSFVNETNTCHECYNFDPLVIDGEDGEALEVCLGSPYVPGAGGNDIQFHIEKIPGCELMKDEDQIDDVLVVFVSKPDDHPNMYVVGFYKHATVYRYLQECEEPDGGFFEFRFLARGEDCVLLPREERFRKDWMVPAASSKYHTFGFGRSNIWYAGKKGSSEEEIAYVERMIHTIESYDGENWTYLNLSEEAEQ